LSESLQPQELLICISLSGPLSREIFWEIPPEDVWKSCVSQHAICSSACMPPQLACDARTTLNASVGSRRNMAVSLFIRFPVVAQIFNLDISSSQLTTLCSLLFRNYLARRNQCCGTSPSHKDSYHNITSMARTSEECNQSLGATDRPSASPYIGLCLVLSYEICRWTGRGRKTTAKATEMRGSNMVVNRTIIAAAVLIEPSVRLFIAVLSYVDSHKYPRTKTLCTYIFSATLTCHAGISDSDRAKSGSRIGNGAYSQQGLETEEIQ